MQAAGGSSPSRTRTSSARTDQTSAVHFLRFELDNKWGGELPGGAPLMLGVDHPNYRHELSPPRRSCANVARRRPRLNDRLVRD